jgi:hypothetical protein
VTGGDRVGPVRRDDQRRGGPQVPSEEGEQFARRRIGPVKVLEHQHGRRRAVAESFEHAEDRLEKPGLCRLRADLGRDLPGPSKRGNEARDYGPGGSEDLLELDRVERTRQAP